MDWEAGHDGSATAEWKGPNRLVVELLREAGRPEGILAAGGDHPHVTLWRPAPGAQVAIPAHYTPSYAYPLLVWLCDDAASEADIGRWLERISPRNYIALGLRRDLYGRHRKEASADPLHVRMSLPRYASVVRRVAGELRLHPERHYVAGAGSAGRIAIEWLLRRPDWFAGGIVIDVDRPAAAAWRTIPPGLCRQRLLWIETALTASGQPESPDPVALRCLGLRVDEWRPIESASWGNVADRMNHWIMTDIPTAVLR